MDKECSTCKRVKKLEDFRLEPRTKDGRTSACTRCLKEYYKRWRKGKIEKDSLFYHKKTERYGLSNRKQIAERRRTVEGRVAFLISSTRSRCKSNKIKFDLTEEWLLLQFKKQDNCCYLTGLEFDLDPVKPGSINPFSPSLDRIVAGGGYTKNNIRLVCSGINLALRDFGLGTFTKICVEFIKHSKIITT